MKKRFAAVGCVCAFALAPLFVSSAMPASAVDTSIINQGVFQQYIPTITGTYVDTSLAQKPITFSYNTVQYIIGSNIAASNPNQTGRAVYMYTARVPSDIYMQGIAPYVTVDIDFGLDNVTYMDTGVLTWVGDYNNKFFNYNLASLRPYNFTEVYYGGQDITYMQTMNQDVTMPGWFQISESSVRYSGWQYIFESSSPKEFNWGTAHISTMATDYGYIWLGIISPIVNDDYVVKGAVAPPTPGSTQYGASGQISGTVGSDPITADFDIVIQSPDYSEQFDIIIDPSLTPSQSDALDGLSSVNSTADDIISDYDDVVHDIDSYQWEIDGDSFALDTIDGDLPDLTPPSNVIDGVNDLWDLLELDRAAPIIIRYIPIFIIFAFGSYVIYGKWV